MLSFTEKDKLYADIDASYGGSEGQARANTLRLKCAFLCCAMHTVPNELPSSLAGDYAQMLAGACQVEVRSASTSNSCHSGLTAAR